MELFKRLSQLLLDNHEEEKGKCFKGHVYLYVSSDNALLATEIWLPITQSSKRLGEPRDTSEVAPMVKNRRYTVASRVVSSYKIRDVHTSGLQRHSVCMRSVTRNSGVA